MLIIIRIILIDSKIKLRNIMKNKLSILIMSIFMLVAHGAAYASTHVDHPPAETIILKLPSNSCANWKEIGRSVTEKEGIVERIPFNQTVKNCSEHICIQFYDRSTWGKMRGASAEKLLDQLRETILTAYPGNKVTWKIIEKNENDFIYEWILHKPYKDVSPQHEIARYFLTENGFHRIGFTRKNAEMNAAEREGWIKLLKENTSVVSFEEAANTSEGLSMVDRIKNSVDLGSAFQDWTVLDTFVYDNGYTLVSRISPAQQRESYIAECLEVATKPISDPISIDKLIKLERTIAQGKSKKVKFRVIKKTPTEVIYTYSYPKDHLILNAVVRAFDSDQGYYSISYKHGLNNEIMKEDEIQHWVEKLEAIKIR